MQNVGSEVCAECGMQWNAESVTSAECGMCVEFGMQEARSSAECRGGKSEGNRSEQELG